MTHYLYHLVYWLKGKQQTTFLRPLDGNVIGDDINDDGIISFNSLTGKIIRIPFDNIVTVEPR